MDALKAFDQSDNVFVAIAHDIALLPIVTWFPNGSINKWKELSWKEKSRWGFLDQLPIEGNEVEAFVLGLVRDGKIVE